MARIRTIKPQFWLNEELGTIPRDARLLYIGLWNISDDRGVFLWRPAQIKIQLFPYDQDLTASDVEKWLNNLVEIKHLYKFQEDGKWFGYCPNFQIHQDIKNPSKWTHSKTTPVLPQSYGTTTPALLLGKEERVIGKELEVKSKELDSDGDLAKVIKVFESCGGTIATPMLAEKLKDITQEYGLEIVIAAFEKAAAGQISGPRIINYCQPIFEQYKTNGIPSKSNGNKKEIKTSSQVEGMIIHE